MKSEIKQKIETELDNIIQQKLQELNLNPELDDPEQGRMQMMILLMPGMILTTAVTIADNT